MSTVAKFLAGLALILPMTGYVVGSLVSSSAREPERRDPVIVNDVGQQSPSDDGLGPSPQPSARPGRGSDTGGDGGDDRDVDQNGITVVKPETNRPYDDGDDDGDDDRDDRDDRTDTDDD